LRYNYKLGFVPSELELSLCNQMWLLKNKTMNQESDVLARKSISDGSKSSDLISALAKGAIGSAVGLAGAVTGLGAVAIVGPLAVEVIPNQRQNRVEKLLKIFSSKICNMSEEEVEQKFHTPEFLDVFENCIYQAIRTISDDRLEYLASILEKSLTEEQTKHLQTKRLLLILSELNDAEVIILQSYGFKNPNNSEFKRQHNSIFQNAHIPNRATEEEREEYSIYMSYRDHLINLGLIGPTANKSGSSQLYLTPLGSMLLKLLGRKIDLVIGTPISPVSAMLTAEEGIAKIEKDSKTKNQVEKDSFRRSQSQQERDLAEKVIRGLRRP